MDPAEEGKVKPRLCLGCLFQDEISRWMRYNAYIIYSHQQKLVLLHLWRVNVKTIGGFINITFADFFIDKTAP
jgi:hypothetical protein